MKRWRIEFLSRGRLGDAAPSKVAREYVDIVDASSPDDAMHKLSNRYLSVRVKRCYEVDRAGG